MRLNEPVNPEFYGNKLSGGQKTEPNLIFVRNDMDKPYPTALITTAHEGLHYVDDLFFTRWVEAEMKLKKHKVEAPTGLFERFARPIRLDEITETKLGRHWQPEHISGLQFAHESGEWTPYMVSKELYITALEGRAHDLSGRLVAPFVPGREKQEALKIEADGYWHTQYMTNGHVLTGLMDMPRRPVINPDGSEMRPMDPHGMTFPIAADALKRMMQQSIDLADKLPK